tara:strand:- start:491 stop:1018 length:528 start_codon:yes stop_codon:yes gene_type:complete
MYVHIKDIYAVVLQHGLVDEEEKKVVVYVKPEAEIREDDPANPGTFVEVTQNEYDKETYWLPRTFKDSEELFAHLVTIRWHWAPTGHDGNFINPFYPGYQNPAINDSRYVKVTHQAMHGDQGEESHPDYPRENLFLSPANRRKFDQIAGRETPSDLWIARKIFEVLHSNDTQMAK